MVVMALDHTRDFLSHDALLFRPLDLTKPRRALVHAVDHSFLRAGLCFLAGAAAFLSLTRGKRRLISRGYRHPRPVAALTRADGDPVRMDL